MNTKLWTLEILEPRVLTKNIVFSGAWGDFNCFLVFPEKQLKLNPQEAVAVREEAIKYAEDIGRDHWEFPVGYQSVLLDSFMVQMELPI